MDAAKLYYNEHKTPNVIILESKLSSSELLEKIDSFAEVCDEGSQVVVIGAENDIGIYCALSRRGVSEYLVPPLDSKDLSETVSTICVDPSEPQLGRTIAFIGANGGVGSSSVAHNVAWSISEFFKEDVALVDLDIPFGTAGLAFNIESQQGIHVALSQPDRLDEVLLDGFMPKHNDHLMVLISPASLAAESEIPMDAFEPLLGLVRRKAPFVILDLPNVAWSQEILVDADDVVITATPDLASIRHAKGLIEALKKKRDEDAPLHLVLNHVGAFKKTELTVKDFEEGVKMKPFMSIPHEPALFGSASNFRQMLGEVTKRNKIVDKFQEFAQTLTGREPTKAKKSAMDIFKFKKAKK